MIKPVRIGDSFSGGSVDRVINIHWGAHRVSHTFDCIEYECLFRLNDGSWYMSEQCDGPTGGEMTTRLSAVDNSTVEAYADERKTVWKKRGGSP